MPAQHVASANRRLPLPDAPIPYLRRSPASGPMSSRSRSVRAAALGTLAGGAAGFALGLLLAPGEGRQLRRRAAFLLDQWADDLQAVVRRLDDDDSPATSIARTKADALVADARVQAQALLSEADALIDAARQRRADGLS